MPVRGFGYKYSAEVSASFAKTDVSMHKNPVPVNATFSHFDFFALAILNVLFSVLIESSKNISSSLNGKKLSDVSKLPGWKNAFNGTTPPAIGYGALTRVTTSFQVNPSSQSMNKTLSKPSVKAI